MKTQYKNEIWLDDVRLRIIDRVLGKMLGSITLSLALYDNNIVNLETVPLSEVPSGNIVIYRNVDRDICVGVTERIYLLHGWQMVYAISDLNNEGWYWYSEEQPVVDTGVRL